MAAALAAEVFFKTSPLDRAIRSYVSGAGYQVTTNNSGNLIDVSGHVDQCACTVTGGNDRSLARLFDIRNPMERAEYLITNGRVQSGMSWEEILDDPTVTKVPYDGPWYFDQTFDRFRRIISVWIASSAVLGAFVSAGAQDSIRVFFAFVLIFVLFGKGWITGLQRQLDGVSASP